VELIEENQVRTLQACRSESGAIWVHHAPPHTHDSTHAHEPTKEPN
jgi:hypothetical protein